MKRVAIVALVLLVVAAGWFIYSRRGGEGNGNDESEYTTEPAVLTDIEAVVSATGSVMTEREQSLMFSTGGRVAEVLVEVGDEVAAGQELARLEDEDLLLNLQQAQAALRISEAQLAKTQAGPTEQDIAVYEAALEIARAGVVSAEAGLASAQANLAKVEKGAAEEEIAIAERRIEEAKNTLWAAQAQRDAVCGRVKYGAAESDCDSAEANVNSAEEGVRIAELQLQQLTAGASSEDIASAQAQVDQARGQLLSAQAQVVKAEADLERAQMGTSAEDVAVAQAQVDQAAVNVALAEDQLDDLVLTAPADGQIAEWDLFVGDLVAPNTPLGSLISKGHYYVEASIDETEIGLVEVGQKARVTLDAFPDEMLQGEVLRISVSGRDAQGIVMYTVEVRLPESERNVKPMMTATVDLVVAEKEDVLAVPNRALRRDDKGRYVEVLVNGSIARRDVVLGVSNTEMTEVVEGISEGEKVIVSRPRTSLFSGGS